MTIKERQSDLLYAAIAEHIRMGDPVSSEDLRKRYRFPYSPATIRNELLRLTELGYLAQPHTSAGRIPTDAGYRWYVEKVRGAVPLGRDERRTLIRLKSVMDDFDVFFRESTEAFASIAHTLAIGGALGGRELHKSGFEHLLSEPEFSDQDLRNGLGALIDSIDLDIMSLVSKGGFDETRVFIGHDNPIRQARPYSMIVKTLKSGGGVGVLALIGSKRMRYDKGIQLLDGVSDFIEAEVN